jgi:glyoxylase-like metal-dependent hydrolase (beta-lactamase superfamily II)
MEIMPHVHRIPGLKGAGVYLLVGSSLALVDSGMPGSDEAILAYVESLDREPADLSRIIVTHHHLDHVGSLAALKQRTGAQVLAHPSDAPFLTGEQQPPLPRGGITRILFRLTARAMPQAEPVPVDLTVEDGDRLDLLGGATVVHVPGHTRGAIALHFPSERLLICGDAINHRGSRLGPPPEPFTADMDQAIASLQRLAGLEFDVLCPGHGAPIVSGADEQVRAMVRELG